MANYHVTKNREINRWQVRRALAERVSAFTKTQHQAEKMAKKFAANSGGGEVRIHGMHGPIRDSDTIAPAKDPFPPRDWVH